MRQNKTPTVSTDEELRKIVDRLEGALDESAVRAAAAVVDQVAVYRELNDDDLERDLVAHVRAVFRMLITSLVEARPVGPEDFSTTRMHAARRVRQGVPLAAFLQALRVGQLTLWEEVLAVTRDNPETRETALSLVERIMHHMEICSTQAAEAFLEAERLQFAETDRLRRDVLDDLLAGSDVSTAPKLAVLRSAGLDPASSLVVVLARAVAPLRNDMDIADALTAIGRRDTAATGITVARQNEIVGIIPVAAGRLQLVVTGLERAVNELASRGIELAVGVSTAHTRLHKVPEAYAEAWAACEGLGPSSGVLALGTLNTFDYLMLRADDTARRLVRPEFRRFVEEDVARGGGLVATVLEFVACDLNATAAAKRMHMHVNTVYYRLNRVAERSGCDMRRFTELQELIIAVHLYKEAAGS